MIYTLTPNPTLDLSGTVELLIPNEKNYISNETRNPGGSAINVARILTRLNVPVIAIGFLGKYIGSEIISLLNKEHVHHKFIKIQGHTRINMTLSNSKTQLQTRLSFAGPRIRANEIESLVTQMKQIPRSGIFILGGSFPPGLHISDVNHIIREMLARQIPVVVDIPGHLLRKIHLKDLLLIKPNLTEFQELIGHKATSLKEITRAAQKLAQKVHLVCISSVKGGAILASRDYIWFGSLPKIKILSSVGAGDSMVAGIVAELWRRKLKPEMCNDDSLLPDLLRRGLAAAAATLSLPSTSLGEPKLINQFYHKIKIRKVLHFETKN
jgi:1-phosphofructokinase family hexose kinase